MTDGGPALLTRTTVRMARGPRAFTIVLVVLVGALFFSLIAAVGIGPLGIPFADVWGVIGHRLLPGLFPAPSLSSGEITIAWEIRVP